MKHTQGTWHVNPWSAQIDVFTPEPVPICKLLWPSDERGEEETEANAHLIAAAPDMYGMLVTIARSLRPGYFLNEVMEVINKAEGKNNAS